MVSYAGVLGSLCHLVDRQLNMPLQILLLHGIVMSRIRGSTMQFANDQQPRMSTCWLHQSDQVLLDVGKRFSMASAASLSTKLSVESLHDAVSSQHQSHLPQLTWL